MQIIKKGDYKNEKNLIAIIALTAALAASTSAFADTVQISEEELNKPVSTYAPDAMPTPEIQGDIMLLNGEEKDAVAQMQKHLLKLQAICL